MHHPQMREVGRKFVFMHELGHYAGTPLEVNAHIYALRFALPKTTNVLFLLKAIEKSDLPQNVKDKLRRNYVSL